MFSLWINKKFHLLKLWIINIQGHLIVSSFPQLTRMVFDQSTWVALVHLLKLVVKAPSRKRKKIEPYVENNGRWKSSLENCESFMNQSFIEELSNDDDIIEEGSDPDVVIIEEEDHEEESDHYVVIIAEEDPIYVGCNR
ncbi:hypothetical protein H5410_003003 [Solanum commersonii]|uniref:Uncharacterized protein n=1 Tax=Solanum commersonii TaxID=4109 RepID=A0A9J6B3H6_SOLCO|nr:hypothetical protein H5410_003003 [Solanum commersonii]